jgi:multimeric flavodoxin WrbA
MNVRKHILAINGSYRAGGITDQAIDSLAEDLRGLDVEVEHIKLRDFPIRFCTNCRECMQQPGDAPGNCIHEDGMAGLIEKIEAADGYILAAPTNFYSVTAIFKRFMERLAPFGYWPWGKPAPVFRRAKMPQKPALIVTSCAAPGLMGRLSYGTNNNLKVAARTMGAKVVGSIVTGLIARKPDRELPQRARRRARKLAPRLVA